MSHERLAYDDPAPVTELTADARVVDERLSRAVRRPAPSIAFADYPRDVPKPRIEISAAAARLASALTA